MQNPSRDALFPVADWIGTVQPISVGKMLQKGFGFIICSSFDSLRKSEITFDEWNCKNLKCTCRMKEPPNHNGRIDHWEANLWDNDWISKPNNSRIHTSGIE